MVFWKRKSKNVFSGKNKAKKYLIAHSNESNHQIDILRMYVNGFLEETLKKYSFDLIEIYIDNLRNKKVNIQINLQHQNKNVGLDFFNDHYEFVFYLAGAHPEDIESSLISYEYTKFSLETLLKDIETTLR